MSKVKSVSRHGSICVSRRVLLAAVVAALAVPWAGAFAQSDSDALREAFKSAVQCVRSDDYATAIRVLEQALPLAQTPEQEAEVALLWCTPSLVHPQ